MVDETALKPPKQQYRRSNGRRPAEAGPLYVGTYVDVDQLSKCWKKAFNISADPYDGHNNQHKHIVLYDKIDDV